MRGRGLAHGALLPTKPLANHLSNTNNYDNTSRSSSSSSNKNKNNKENSDSNSDSNSSSNNKNNVRSSICSHADEKEMRAAWAHIRDLDSGRHAGCKRLNPADLVYRRKQSNKASNQLHASS